MIENNDCVLTSIERKNLHLANVTETESLSKLLCCAFYRRRGKSIHI